MDNGTAGPLAALVGRLLKAKGEKLVTAESCTGGGVAEAVTAISGSSEWFDRGFITYSNEAKMEMLKVSAATLASHGAVSEETVGKQSTCSAEQKAKVKEALIAYQKAGPTLAPAEATAAAPGPAATPASAPPPPAKK